MIPTSPRILALNPGSRYLGLAFFDGPQLQDWRVKVFRGRFSATKGRRIVAVVSDAIDFYAPTIVVVKRLHRSRRSDHLADTVKQIKTTILAAGLQLREYGIDTLKITLGAERVRNKVRLAELLAQEYPILRCQFDAEQHSRNPYHIRMFEAVALGACCAQRPSRDYH